MLNFSFLEIAEIELQDAIAHYQGKEPWLGIAFLEEAERAIERMLQFPEACPKILGEYRRCQLRRFPYHLIYIIEKDLLFIVAVMHAGQKPDYWRHRL